MVYYVPAKRECCIPQSSPGHHEIQADLIPSQLGGEPDTKIKICVKHIVYKVRIIKESGLRNNVSWKMMGR